MKYRLSIITHGSVQTLEETLATFQEMVEPKPHVIAINHDAGDLGFCGNTRKAWMDAVADKSVDYVFHLEHDFRFLRPVHLAHLAHVLDRNPQLAQMALMRDAINENEKKAGGVYRFHRFDGIEHKEVQPWLEHTSNLTTNPSLMTRKFMEENPWPEYESECEGKFSGDLRRRGYTYGYWDLAEVYVEHTGQLRTGYGY